MPSRSTTRLLFRTTAAVEAVTWAGLLVGMTFKYLVNGVETGVHVFGPLHGAAFIAYVVTALLAARVFGWRTPTVLLALAASIPPLATWVFEVWADRSDRLTVEAPVPAAPHMVDSTNG